MLGERKLGMIPDYPAWFGFFFGGKKNSASYQLFKKELGKSIIYPEVLVHHVESMKSRKIWFIFV
jgi:hypothetical protein